MFLINFVGEWGDRCAIYLSSGHVSSFGDGEQRKQGKERIWGQRAY